MARWVGISTWGTDTCWVESPPFTACKAALVFSIEAIRQTNERSSSIAGELIHGNIFLRPQFEGKAWILSSGCLSYF